MCGLAGFISNRVVVPASEWPSVLRRMGDTIVHRGPDDSGVWIDTDAGVGIVHRRLSILDLSPAGHQPMVSASGRFVIAFNGEIYNHLSLRDTLEKTVRETAWRGHSDTETLLAAFEAWGVDATLNSCVGMFAIALWDRRERSLTIARDRLGEKPLYYGWSNGNFLFASELKALRVHPSFNGNIDRDSLTLFLRHSCIPAPYSIYQDICKLLPGTYLTVSADRQDEHPITYWSAGAVAAVKQSRPFAGSNREAVDQLELLLRQAVRQQMVAEVPIGSFLSGGIDSSTIVALMQTQSSMPIRTFTIGFHDMGYNEAELAKAVARHLGTDHTELYVTPQQALDVISRLPHIYDEPFSDSSQIPTFLLSQMVRKHVSVSLSGDAGDELFGGYKRYSLGNMIGRSVECIPAMMRKHLAYLLTKVSVERWDNIFKNFEGLIPFRFRYENPGDKIKKFSDIISSANKTDIYSNLVSHWKTPSSIVLGSKEPITALSDTGIWSQFPDMYNAMMYTDMISYLPDDILVKVDRAAMAVSLETRVPFLDHRVVEFVWSLPLSLKIRNGQGKWILRQVLNKYVPKELIERPKMGFGVPINAWLRGPLREWAEALLNEERLRQEGYFHPEPIRQKWHEHLSGVRNWHYCMWDVLMFQAWLESQRNTII